MASEETLRKYLHEHIPLSKAMGVEVLEATPDGVRLSAPLSPNINHRETVFGGSASAVAILSAWSLIHLRLKNENMDSRIVIRRSTVTYERPITDAFTASSVIRDPTSWPKFVGALRRKSLARITVNAVLHCNDGKAGEFEGEFAAMGTRKP